MQGLDTSVMLACPDMMFLTRHSLGRAVLGPGVTRQEWRQLATKHQLQGVRTSFQLGYHHQFSCPEVGLRCDNWSQAAAFLTPWCCVLAFRHVVASLETVAEQVSRRDSLLGQMEIICLEVQSNHRQSFHITEKAPTRACLPTVSRPGRGILLNCENLAV